MRHFLSLKNLEHSELIQLIHSSFHFFQSHKTDTNHKQNALEDRTRYDGKVLVNLLLEPSTRTRFSFHMAAEKLGMSVINVYPEFSSVVKGEDLLDTIKVFEAQGADAICIRLKDEGVLAEVASKVSIPIINAGEGKLEHPSQALLDIAALVAHAGFPLEETKSEENDRGEIGKKTIGIIGDIPHSRVASSHFHLWEKLVAKVLQYIPSELSSAGGEEKSSASNFEQVLAESDVLMFLRVQFERIEHLSDPEKNELKQSYFNSYGVSLDRVLSLQKNSSVGRPWILHPGPVNWGVELDRNIINYENCLIDRQVEMGVYARMAILDWLLGAK